MNYAIEIHDLKKTYGNHVVLKGLNFNVQKGEIFALLGVNGASKTTTLECMENLRKYDSGSIVVNGTTGIQLQSASLPENIKPMEAIKLFSKWNKTDIDYSMTNALGINELVKKKYSDMSMGQKRRLHLALALISDPDIIFLDEPTAGLDVEGRISLHEQIRKLKKKGKTIILASHDMAEVESLCDRIAILNHGKIIFLGTVNELFNTIDNHYVINIETDKGIESYKCRNIADTMLSLLEDYKKRKINVLDINIDKGTLEQHFMDLARGNV